MASTGKSYGSPPRVWGKSTTWMNVTDEQRFTPTGVGKIAASILSERFLAVHPHGCGENCENTSKKIYRHGSPPRVWGKCHQIARGEHCTRFTPTGVGKIEIISPGRSSETVHPHGCGENDNMIALLAILLGSPPRVWGKCQAI